MWTAVVVLNTARRTAGSGNKERGCGEMLGDTGTDSGKIGDVKTRTPLESGSGKCQPDWGDERAALQPEGSVTPRRVWAGSDMLEGNAACFLDARERTGGGRVRGAGGDARGDTMRVGDGGWIGEMEGDAGMHAGCLTDAGKRMG